MDLDDLSFTYNDNWAFNTVMKRFRRPNRFIILVKPSFKIIHWKRLNVPSFWAKCGIPPTPTFWEFDHLKRYGCPVNTIFDPLLKPLPAPGHRFQFLENQSLKTLSATKEGPKKVDQLSSKSWTKCCFRESYGIDLEPILDQLLSSAKSLESWKNPAIPIRKRFDYWRFS